MAKVKLEDVCYILDNKRIPVTASDRKPGPYPYYGANGVQDYVSEYIFDDELVLLAEDGGNFGSKDRPIAYRVSGKCWVNNHAHVLKPKNNINVDYLCYSIMFYDVGTLVNGATRKKLNQADMRKMIVNVPPIEKQIEIVDKISKLEKLIENRKQQLEKLDMLVKSQFIEMFGDPIENPINWEISRLTDLGTCKNGMNFHAGDSGIELNCLGVGDFKDLAVITDTSILPKVSLNEEPSEEYLLQDGDIVFVRSNGNKMLVGRCLAVYPQDIKTTFSGFCIRYRLISEKVHTVYLLHLLKTTSARQKLVGRGANIQNLNQKILGELMIPVPPLELQNEFVGFIQQADKSKFTIQQSLEKLETLKKSLMQEYFG